MRIKEPEIWMCQKCGKIHPSIKPYRKRKEYYTKCPECGAKRLPVAL